MNAAMKQMDSLGFRVPHPSGLEVQSLAQCCRNVLRSELDANSPVL